MNPAQPLINLIYFEYLYFICAFLLLAALVRQTNRMSADTHNVLKAASILMAFGTAVKMLAAWHQMLSAADLMLSSLIMIGITIWIYFDRRAQ